MNDKPLFVIDLDRTLVDTDKVVALLYEALNKSGYDSSKVSNEINEALKNNQEINTKKAIDVLGAQAWDDVAAYFKDYASESQLVYDDAQDFVKKLEQHKYPYIILTFGLSQHWQQLKIKAAGLDTVPFIITDSRNKGSIISSWQHPNGVYMPPGFDLLKAHRLLLVDDRLSAFVGLPEDCKGYLVARSGEDDPKVPANVAVIKSLREIEI